MGEATHSPLPWAVSFNPCHFDTRSDINDANGDWIASTRAAGLIIEKDAALIVQSVNERPSLIAQRDALREALEKAAGALTVAAREPLHGEGSAIKFTGEFAHIGSATVSEILGETDAALSLAKGGK